MSVMLMTRGRSRAAASHIAKPIRRSTSKTPKCEFIIVGKTYTCAVMSPRGYTDVVCSTTSNRQPIVVKRELSRRIKAKLDRDYGYRGKVYFS